MAEDTNPEEIRPEERVKKQQLAIASSMKVEKAVLYVLNTVADWHVREWLYICAVDGMPAEQLKNFAETKTNVLEIKKERMVFLRDRYVQTDPLQLKIETLQKEVQEVCQESRQARSTIENGLEDALKKQAQAQTETIHVKDEIIAMLKNQVLDLQEDRKAFPSEKEIVPKSGTDNTVLEALDVGAKTLHRTKKKSGAGQLLSLIRRNAETKKFIERYIQSDKMSTEQTNFLLDCLEEGMSVKDIEAFAAPGLSLEMMSRLKKFSQKDYGEE
ncbi:MAG TPA: hypothetical protein DIW17_00755 [Clostridiales bacterium]|jgi:ACT domain-containing protein|uniref:hypothetical protein n=1 Tax=Clostridia TaxID=186801 RepID=UPI0007407894|nr:hypothetical protein [Clostridium sp. C105KSO13]CUX28244.1 hypothetical protein BN3456_01061 [Clostridium sp. C105KSO13]HAX51799.1 hypothetical protein [Lachnospiraceae bacterium]HCS72392.1 hypothetical protein [Clostridiales bacterium]